MNKVKHAVARFVFRLATDPAGFLQGVSPGGMGLMAGGTVITLGGIQQVAQVMNTSQNNLTKNSDKAGQDINKPNQSGSGTTNESQSTYGGGQ